jgi:hypothetical protein
MNRQRWQDWAVALVGVWVFLTPWVLSYFFPAAVATGTVAWSYWIVGVAMAASGLAAVFAYQIWEEWADVVLGVWLVLSPWVLGFVSLTALTWNAVIMGALAVLLSASVLYTGSSTMKTA